MFTSKFHFQFFQGTQMPITQMMVVRQNVLTTIMLKNVKLANGNVRLRLETPEIYRTINSSSSLRINILKTVELNAIKFLIKT